MGKRLLNLYVEDADIELAKANNTNLSALFREVLSISLNETSNSDKERIAKLTNELSKANLLIKELETKLSKQEEKNGRFRRINV